MNKKTAVIMVIVLITAIAAAGAVLFKSYSKGAKESGEMEAVNTEATICESPTPSSDSNTKPAAMPAGEDIEGSGSADATSTMAPVTPKAPTGTAGALTPAILPASNPDEALNTTPTGALDATVSLEPTGTAAVTQPLLTEATITPASKPALAQAPQSASVPTSKPVATPTPKPTITPKPTATPAPTATPVSANMSVYEFMDMVVDAMNIPKEVGAEYVGYSTLTVNNIIDSSVWLDVHKGEVITRELAFVILADADKYLKHSYDSEVYNEAVDNARIADIKKFDSSYRTSAYYVYSQGIVEGKSTGTFSKKRNLKPVEELTESDAKIYIARMMGTKTRAALTDDAQVCRTTNLPELARLYPYILDSFPNEYYDWNFNYQFNSQDGELWGQTDKFLYSKWASPVDLEGLSQYRYDIYGLYSWWPDGTEHFGTYEDIVNGYKDTWKEQIETFVMTSLNVDYRTLRGDTAWQNALKSVYYRYNDPSVDYQYQKGMDEDVATYIDNAEKNKTIIECDEVDFDMSTLHFSNSASMGNWYVKVHVHYRIVSTTIDLTGTYSKGNPLMFCAFPNSRGSSGYYQSGIELGEWIDDYFYVGLDHSEGGCGISTFLASPWFHEQAIRPHM